ncbi:MAG: efflux RND transporter periplasmic adaptor subunit [Methylococcales bacterium]
MPNQVQVDTTLLDSGANFGHWIPAIRARNQSIPFIQHDSREDRVAGVLMVDRYCQMNRVLRGPALLGAILLWIGCNQPEPQPQAQNPPPAEVAVSEVHLEELALTRELVGRLQATRTAEVRARVAGILLERVYREGSDVNQGQVLFRIDPEPLKARAHAREAALDKAKADADNAAAIEKRLRGLAERKLISDQDLDTAAANERATAAAVRIALAELESARLDLGYATVTAPIAGRAGRSLVTEGALVGQNDATQLTKIEQIDSLYVNFSLPVKELGDLRGNASGRSPVTLEVSPPEEIAAPQSAQLDFSDLAVDPVTGVVSLRGVLANPDRALLPGMYVNLRLTNDRVANAFMLPQSALARDAGGAYVLVVDANGKVFERRVEIRGMTNNGFIVQGELRDSERVIVEGLQKTRPGDTVRTVSAPGPAADTR